MFQEILFPTDGSEPARKALDVAVNMADKYDARLHILSVVEIVVYPEYPDMTTAKEVETERSEDVVENAKEEANYIGVSTETSVVQDVDPHEAITSYCNDHDIDLIVMGTHGRSGLERLLLGSTTERTLRTVELPIMCVPMKEE